MVSRWFRGKGVKRRALSKNRSSDISVFKAVESELYGSSSDVGYRRMHKIITNKGIICRRDDVRKLLTVLDPKGVQLRGKRRIRRRKYYEDPVVLDCKRYCFMHLIRKDLVSITEDWNSHLISKSRSNSGPSGRPNCMFSLPHLYDASDFSKLIDQEEVNEFYPTVDCNLQDYSIEFGEFASIVMTDVDIAIPTNPKEALNLYIFLLQKIKELE